MVANLDGVARVNSCMKAQCSAIPSAAHMSKDQLLWLAERMKLIPLCAGHSPSAGEGGEADPPPEPASHGFAALCQAIFLPQCSTHCNKYTTKGVFICKNYWEEISEEDGGEVEATRHVPSAWLRRRGEASVNAPLLTNRRGPPGPLLGRWWSTPWPCARDPCLTICPMNNRLCKLNHEPIDVQWEEVL